MSVTFYCPKAPTTRVQPYVSEPDYWENRPEAPFIEINMSEGNAWAMLQLIDPDSVHEDGCYGEWAPRVDLPRIRRAIILALNTAGKDALVKPVEITGGNGQCLVVECGRSPGYVVQRLQQFLALTTAAMDHGYAISFG